MMSAQRFVALMGITLLGLLMAACSAVPRPSTYPYSFQPQMQAAKHWQTLAVQMVESLPSRTEPVYLPEDDSPFGRALRSFLETELTKRGIAMAPTELQGLTLAWEVQTIRHAEWRHKPHLPFPGVVLEPLAFLVSPGVVTGRLPHYEVIITTKIHRQEDLLRQQSDIFYVNDSDWWHYVPPKVLAPVPECDHAQVRAQCPFYQYREGTYRAKCEDGSRLVVSMGTLTVVPPPIDRPHPWQAEGCSIVPVHGSLKQP